MLTKFSLKRKLKVGADCVALEPTTFAKHPRSETEGAGCEPLKTSSLNNKWARRDSNPRPHGCEPCALTS